jgi:thioredoxin 1
MRLLAAILVCLVASAQADDLLVFTRPGCPPCEAAKAALAEDPSIAVGYKLQQVDVQQNREMARKYGVSSVPVFVIVRSGKEVRRTVGFRSVERLRDWLDSPKLRRRWR